MNPFQDLKVQDDEEEFIQTKEPKKEQKKTGQKKQGKIKESSEPQKNVNQAIPLNVRQNVKARNYKDPKPQKGIPEGHTLDRRSGTGRIDKPRKEGGGKGNLGNIKDELQKDKYIKQEDPTEEVEHESTQTQGMTLNEYYKNKGVDLKDLQLKKEDKKKSDIDADWIKKEKLQLMETKQQEKLKTRNTQFNSKRQYTDKVGLNSEMNTDMLGFTSKPQNQPKAKKVKEEKLTLKEEDFPAL